MILLLFSCIISGVLGRLGGWEKGNRLFRILGIPLLSAIISLKMGCFSPLLLLMVGIMAVALSTYWDFLSKDKEANLYMHGLVIGISLLPIAIITQHWIGFLTSCLVITLWMGIWSKLISWDVLEEFGRYFVIPIGAWLLLK